MTEKLHPTMEAGGLAFEFGLPQGSLLLRRKETGERLILAGSGCPFAPVIDGAAPAGTVSGIEVSESAVAIRCGFAPGAPIGDFTFHIARVGEAFDLWCEFRVIRDCQLNAIRFFPAETALNFYDVVNFRNRHFCSGTWPELLLGTELETTTYSDDWQFAPHPSAMLFRKNEFALFAGTVEVQATFGMHLKTKRYRVADWSLDYGPHPHGQVLREGERFQSARLRLFARSGASPYDLFTEFGRMLVAGGEIADPAAKERFAWWKEPLYCTWIDQCLVSRSKIAVELIDQTENTAAAVLNEDFVCRAVEVIRRERLPIRTILLDEGWAVTRGDWRPHPKRFPDLRGLVDELHAQGFKVMVWWNWAELYDEAHADPRHLVGGGWRNKHGAILRDYSSPATQNEYLIPLIRQLISSEPGCYDLDGVKTDFLADKIHPETPLADPSWRGEERYFLKVTELFYLEMKRHKPDAMHLAGAGNYHLAEFIDLNRTYDVHTSNWLEHEERARMLEALSPGAPVSYDMMVMRENMERWFASARCRDAAVEIGNVVALKDDTVSEPRLADAAYWAMLRRELGCGDAVK